VVITGSLHVVGEAMEKLGLAASEAERGLNEYGMIQPLAGIRALTFDVGGTLIEPWPSVGGVYAKIAAQHGLEADAEALDRQFAKAWAAKKDFNYSMADWENLVRQTFAGMAKAAITDAMFTTLYEHFATAAPWRIFDDVMPCLRELKKRGLKLGIISNWDTRLRPLLRALQLDSYFDSIVVSAEVGARKPDPRIFQAAAAQMGLPPAAILHVGDSLREDVAGARAAGFQALPLTRGRHPAPLPTMESLPALIK
jgi:putative hydrolase of the HAD superfamily